MTTYREDDIKVIEANRCDNCQEWVLPGDEGGPVYECSRCGQFTEERRCTECNIFAAKAGDASCENCMAPLDTSSPFAVWEIQTEHGTVHGLSRHEVITEANQLEADNTPEKKAARANAVEERMENSRQAMRAREEAWPKRLILGALEAAGANEHERAWLGNHSDACHSMTQTLTRQTFLNLCALAERGAQHLEEYGAAMPEVPFPADS